MKKKWAVVSFTAQGGRLAVQIEQGFASASVGLTRYAFYKYPVPGAIPFENGSRLATEIFEQYDCIVFICACGIAVRLIAPHLVHKRTDPAVIVTDECGQHVISLLSGHAGGANRNTMQIAALLQADPVITTATDVHAAFSPDTFAMENHLYMTDMQMAKTLAAGVIAGEQIGFYSEVPVCELPDSLQPVYAPFPSKTCTYGICVAHTFTQICTHTWHLIPQDIIVGAGCKKGTDPAHFEAVICRQMEAHQLDMRAVRMLASIDLKQEEPALVAFAEKYGIPFETYSAEALMQVQGDFTPSAFVEQTTGVDNVCERSAMLRAEHLLVAKQCEAGVTFAAAKVDMQLLFV